MGCQFSTPIEVDLPPEQSIRRVSASGKRRSDRCATSLPSQSAVPRSEDRHDRVPDKDDTTLTWQDEETEVSSGYHLDAPSSSEEPNDLPPQPQAALWTELGHYFWQRGQIHEAEHLIRQALAHTDHLSSDEQSSAMQTLVTILESKEDWAQAEIWMRPLLHAKQDAVGHTHPDALRATERLARLLQQQNKLDPAEVLYRFVLLHQQDLSNHTTTTTKLSSAYHLAQLLTDKGCVAEAEAWWRQILPEARAVWGPDHVQTLHTMDQLATLIADQTPDEAVSLLRQTVTGRTATLGTHHADTVASVSALARLLHQQQQYPEAETLYRHALWAQTETLGEGHTHTLATRERLANLYVEQEQWSAAEPLLDQTLQALRRVETKYSHRTITCLHTLARINLQMAMWDRATALLQETVEGMAQVYGPGHELTLQARWEMRTAQVHMGLMAEGVADAQPQTLGKVVASFKRSNTV